MRKKIGECLIQSGLITDQDLQVALEEHRRTGERVGAVLVRLNFATEKQITKALAYQLGFPYVSLSDDPPERSATVLIPKEIALKRVCIGVKLEKDLLTVAMSDPLLFSLVQDLEIQTGHQIKQVVATRSDILDSIESVYPDKALATVANGSSGEGCDSTPATELVEIVLKGAVTSRASDVHIEPMERGVLVRHRLDGLLKDAMDLPKPVHDGLVARLKTLAGMEVAEKDLPQVGRFRFKTDGQDLDFHVSTLRTLFGEKVVLRALDQRKNAPPLEELGLSASAMEEVRHFLLHQHGMILVVGPTGSGKTTTLSSALNSIKSSRISVATIENPIEYQIPGVNQTQVGEEAKLTFASALRAMLRQDPDVVFVGDIADGETARIAMQAAQTGRLVMSALHTENAPSTVTRLADMAIEPYVTSAALIGVIAQRLVRRLCVACRRQCTPEAETLRALSIPEAGADQFVFYTAVGCEECHQTGYRGRIALYEVMRVTDKMRRLIAQNAGEDLIREAAVEAGMISLGEDGLVKLKAGITSAEELLRVVTDVREIRTLCPACDGAVAVDFNSCPHCGHRLSHGCPKCSRALQPGWTFCPYCSSNAVSKKKKRKEGKEHTPLEHPSSNVAEFKNQNR